MRLLGTLLFGAFVGWLIWRVSPRWMREGHAPWDREQSRATAKAIAAGQTVPKTVQSNAGTRDWAAAGFNYLTIGYVIGGVVGIGTFVVAYVYCIATYGFLFGLGLGWLPSAILAALVGWVFVFLWGPALIFALVCVAILLAFVR